LVLFVCRVLIYSQFTRTLDILEDWLAGRGWGYERIDGEQRAEPVLGQPSAWAQVVKKQSADFALGQPSTWA
jgi:hypothetical protein